MDVTLRPLDRGDIPAWAGLLAEVEQTDRTGEHYSEADLDEEMDNPDIEVGKDIVGAFDETGRMVGYFAVYPRGVGEEHFKVHVEGATVPDLRGHGIGTSLVAAMLDRAREAHLGQRPDLPARLLATGLSANEDQAGLLGSFGLAPERWNFVMRALLADLPPTPPLADGYRFRQYDESFAEAMFATHNTAFLDHPDFTPWTDVMWKQWVTDSRNFRPALSFVVTPEESDQIVAYVQSNEFDAYFEATGRREAYVAKVGTLREHRGRGIASALLGHCLAAYRDAGFDEASLDVDSENPTGALGVYRRAGFEVESRWTNYALVVG
jgi:mycothiol synthase